MKTSISPGRIVCSPNSGSKKPHLGAEEKVIFYMHSDICDSNIWDSDIWDSDIWDSDIMGLHSKKALTCP